MDFFQTIEGIIKYIAMGLWVPIGIISAFLARPDMLIEALWKFITGQL